MASRELVQIELLKRLKARYFRLLDTKRWEAWGDLFTVDAVLEHPANRDAALVGRDQIVQVVSASLASATTVHHGHTPEIDILGARDARGIWAMEDLVLRPTADGSGQIIYHGYGHYIEEYLKVADEWRIRSLHLSRLHLATTQHMRLVSPTFADAD
jgi:hypothetical protein